MQFRNEQNNFLYLYDDYDKIENNFNFIISRAGWGKTLVMESMVEEYHNAGYTILVLTDPKNEVEFGYAQFEPKERYHLNELNKVGKPIKTRKVKLYHPFTFKIPKTPIPDYNLFTFSLKELKEKEWGLLAETGWNTDTVKLLSSACEEMSDSDGFYSLLHNIQDLTIGKKEGRKSKPDPKNFLLSVSSGTAKSVQDISNYFKPFKTHYFLAPEDCPLNLNWREILSDQEHYHVFVTNFINIKEEKIRDFVTFTLFNKILENKDYAKTPLLIVIPEIRHLIPFRPQGHKIFLANEIKNNLSVMRNMGRGMSALIDTQVFSDVNEDIINSATNNFLGELGGIKDIEKLSKALGYSKGIKEQLSHMESRNSFLMKGYENVGAVRFWLPAHRHCESHYSFLDTFKQEFSGRISSQAHIISQMKDTLRKEENRIKEKIKKLEQKEMQLEEEKQRAKEGTNQENKIEKKMEKAKRIEDKSKKELMRLVYEDRIKNPNKKWRQIGREFKINHVTAQTYFEKYKQIAEGTDFENKAINELDEDDNTGGSNI